MPSSSSQYLSVAVPYAHGVRSLPDLKHAAPAASPSPTSAYRSEYICKRCRARIATRDAVLSWDYRGTQGKAALVTQALNLTPTPPTVLLMDSGAYRVQHLLCSSPSCSPAPSPSPEMTDADTASPALGWRFLRASERAERWKEGCVVLELALLDEVPAPLSPVSPEYAYEPRYRSLAQFPLPPSSLLEPEPAYAYDSDRLSPEPLMMHRRTTSGGSSRSVASRTPSPSPSPYGGRRTPSPLVPSHELGHARSYSHSRTPSYSQLHAHSHSYSHSRPHTSHSHSHSHLHPTTHALSSHSHSHSLSTHHVPPRTPSPSPLHRRAASDLPASRARTPTNASPAAIARAHTTTATTLAARRLQPLGPRVQRASVYHAV